jgi:hypothetical protein
VQKGHSPESTTTMAQSTKKCETTTETTTNRFPQWCMGSHAMSLGKPRPRTKGSHGDVWGSKRQRLPAGAGLSVLHRLEDSED